MKRAAVVAEVRGEYRRSADAFSAWLALQCSVSLDISDVDAIVDMRRQPTHIVVACLTDGTEVQAPAARRELVDRYLADHSGLINDEVRRRRAEMQPTLDRADRDVPSETVLTLIDTKNGDHRIVPVHPRAQHLLRHFPFTAPKITLQRGFQRARRAADLKHVRIHDLRHSAASEMVNAGVDLDTVGKVPPGRSVYGALQPPEHRHAGRRGFEDRQAESPAQGKEKGRLAGGLVFSETH